MLMLLVFIMMALHPASSQNYESRFNALTSLPRQSPFSQAFPRPLIFPARRLTTPTQLPNNLHDHHIQQDVQFQLSSAQQPATINRPIQIAHQQVQPQHEFPRFPIQDSTQQAQSSRAAPQFQIRQNVLQNSVKFITPQTVMNRQLLIPHRPNQHFQPVLQNIPLQSQPIARLHDCGHAGTLVDASRRGHAYHFSWCRNQDTFTWEQANSYCQRLGNGFLPVSLEDADEDSFISNIIVRHPVPWIWTSGNKLGSSSWQWYPGRPLVYNNWSFTGGLGRPQPDNREGNEDCLGVLKNTYNDGIAWHDITCYHKKPVICETSIQI
ncbi:uncharacterized protein [Cherax quadricarinatus]